MSTDSTKRKMAAILSADVKGYSRLMSADEEGTVKTLKQHRITISGIVNEHRGRVVDSPGDNILAEFGSVVDALKSAVKIQETLKGKNAELPENRRMEFRIGVNLGDVIEEEDRIYGDGVNIAARLEGLAEGGGICISGTAFDHVKNKLSVGYQYLGKQTVKNIPDPVRAYKVLMEPGSAGKVIGEKGPRRTQWRWAIAAAVVLVAGALALWNFYWRAPKIEPASTKKMTFPLPDKPSIAVLPFANMSGDPKEDYFSDGLTEQIITSLSMIPRLFVIARNSTFVYKGKAVKVQKVAEEQGVRYVLEGGVQKSEDRVRITVQLIDAIKGHHVWSERYDKELKDLFALQDGIVRQIMTALQVELTEGQFASAIAGSTYNLKALEYFWRASEHWNRWSGEDNAAARQWAERAIELDPYFAGAWAQLGMTHLSDVLYFGGKSPAQSIKRAEECAQKAISINDSFAPAQVLMAGIRRSQGKWDEALVHAEKALAINPNDPRVMTALALTVHYLGRFEECIALTKKAMRVCPYYPALYLTLLPPSYILVGRYQEAIEACELMLDRSRKGEINPLFAHVFLAEAYVGLGELDKAKAQAQEVLKIDPKFSLENEKRLTAFKDPAVGERRLAALRKAGLPDKPPLPLPDKPSIAVLPFVNMSEDKSQEYFSDGLTEEIITALSRTPKLFVIARNSTFVYKGKPVNVQQVSRELGVKYVLEGSVRRSGDQLRITAQLIDATTGNHLWADRYDRKMRDVFTIQDEITMRIINAMQVTLTTGEQARLMVIGTNNLEAYLKVLQGVEHPSRSKVDSIKAIEFFKEAIAIDPDYPVAHAHLALAYSAGVWLGFASSPQDYLRRGLESARKALSLNDSLPIAHNALALCYLMNREHDKAISESKKAITLNPNGAWSNFWLGHILIFAGKPEEAIPYLQAAIRLDPFSRSSYFTHLCMAYREAGRYEEAIAAGQEAIRGEPNLVFAHLALASAYSMIGREEEARAEAAEALRIDPTFSLKRYAEGRPHIDPENTARFVDSLRKAGLK
jgi:adenylate cyclase